MKWGVRKDRDGVPRSTDREARKDAKEYARAKMFYGESAGNRRKLINASVKAKGSRDPAYQRAFDRHLTNQDMAKHASKARGERARKDARNSIGRTTRGIKNVVYGNAGRATVSAIAIVAGAKYLSTTSLGRNARTKLGRQILLGTAKMHLAKSVSSIQNLIKNRK